MQTETAPKTDLDLFEDYITVTDAAKKLEVSPRRIRQFINEGRLSARKIGKQYIITKASLGAFVDKPRKVGQKEKDYTLQKYGMITLTKATDKRQDGCVIWEGLCECGKLVERVPRYLKGSVEIDCIPNCGCIRPRDYTGQKHGMITFTRPTSKKRIYSVIWEGLCECGKLVERVPADLRRGLIPNCGCRPKIPKNKLPPGISARNAVLHSYKNSAELRGYEWDLTDEEAIELFEGDCNCCGDPPTNIKKNRNGNYKYSGIDRVNNDEGYIPANCVSFCRLCNRIKREMTMDELKMHIKKMHDHLCSEQSYQ